MKRIIAMFVLMLLFIPMIPFAPTHVHAAESTEGYDRLKSDNERQAYTILEEGIASLSTVITIPENLDIYFTDLRNAARAVCLDHPDYFWFLESWYYEYEKELNGKEKIQELCPSYFLNGVHISAGSQELLEAQIAFYEEAEEIIAGIPVNLENEYEIALYLHDYLVEHVTYSLDGDHDSAYSALVSGTAACYGYSKAYQYLLNAVGIRASTITGYGVDPSGNKSGHAWNQVWIDGACYFTDVTWDDWEDAVVHAYFMVDLQTFSMDHEADSMFTFEDCNHLHDYYTRCSGNGVYHCSTDTTGEELARNFRRLSSGNMQGQFVCEIRMDGKFDSWMRSIQGDLGKSLGLSYRAEIGYYYTDNIYFLMINDPNYNPPLTEVESIVLNLNDVTLQENGGQVQLIADVVTSAAYLPELTYVSSDQNVAAVDSYGTVTAISPGVATITVSTTDGSISNTCQITVTEKPTHKHTMRLMPESTPTCSLNGCESYYLCTGCGRRFADDNAQKEYTNVSQHDIPATGHLDVNWETDKTSHIKKCSCGKQFTDTFGYHEDVDQNMRCDVCDSPFKSLMPDNQDNTEKTAKVSLLTISLIGIVTVGVVVTVIIIKSRR